jgi:hypothetical protein
MGIARERERRIPRFAKGAKHGAPVIYVIRAENETQGPSTPLGMTDLVLCGVSDLIAPKLVQKRVFGEILSSPLRGPNPRKLLCTKRIYFCKFGTFTLFK